MHKFSTAAAKPSGVPAPLAPETVLYNARIVTVDEGFSIAEAVAIKDGAKRSLLL